MQAKLKDISNESLTPDKPTSNQEETHSLDAKDCTTQENANNEVPLIEDNHQNREIENELREALPEGAEITKNTSEESKVLPVINEEPIVNNTSSAIDSQVSSESEDIEDNKKIENKDSPLKELNEKSDNEIGIEKTNQGMQSTGNDKVIDSIEQQES